MNLQQKLLGCESNPSPRAYKRPHAETHLPRSNSCLTNTVLKTEAGLVTLCCFFPSNRVDEVVMNERLKRVEVTMTRVPLPLAWTEERLKPCRAVIHCLTGEA